MVDSDLGSFSADSVEPALAAAPRKEGRAGKLGRWLLADQSGSTHNAPYEKEEHAQQHVQPWSKVVCLTGVDYFSTLGYQPGIAFLAAGALSPVATFILVLLTLFGALPIYYRVAGESAHGQGSIAMLERLLSWWQGKLFVLALLGFALTDFIITITLSAADATAHIVSNPFAPAGAHHHEVLITLGLIALLGAVFLKGFSEAIGIAVGLTTTYLILNGVVVARGIYEIFTHPDVIPNWQQMVTQKTGGSPFVMVGLALLVFPKLALGLSGFETGVAVMPMVKGAPNDDAQLPQGRIRNTKKLLLTAALIMSVFLIASSFVTSMLIAPQDFCGDGTTIGIPGCVDLQKAGPANGRALALLAHRFFGDGFGTVYDLSTICILWFAGASAMAALLNLVPRYLPRYGMAPEWAKAARPLVLVFSFIAFVVTIAFQGRCRCAGRRLRDRRFGIDYFGFVCRHAFGAQSPANARLLGLRVHHAGFRVYDGRQYFRAARRFAHRGDFHRYYYAGVDFIAHCALDRIAYRVGDFGWRGATFRDGSAGRCATYRRAFDRAQAPTEQRR